jgi:hypothetical protein
MLRAALALAGIAAASQAPGQEAGWTTHPALQDRWTVREARSAPR